MYIYIYNHQIRRKKSRMKISRTYKIARRNKINRGRMRISNCMLIVSSIPYISSLRIMKVKKKKIRHLDNDVQSLIEFNFNNYFYIDMKFDFKTTDSF